MFIAIIRFRYLSPKNGSNGCSFREFPSCFPAFEEYRSQDTQALTSLSINKLTPAVFYISVYLEKEGNEILTSKTHTVQIKKIQFYLVKMLFFQRRSHGLCKHLR